MRSLLQRFRYGPDRRMGRLPGARMTGGTIGRGRVANAEPINDAAAGIMTARTRIMVRCICRINKRAIIVAVSTAGCTHRDTRMAQIRLYGSCSQVPV